MRFDQGAMDALKKDPKLTMSDPSFWVYMGPKTPAPLGFLNMTSLYKNGGLFGVQVASVLMCHRLRDGGFVGER